MHNRSISRCSDFLGLTEVLWGSSKNWDFSHALFPVPGLSAKSYGD